MKIKNKIIKELLQLLSGNFIFSIIGFINIIYVGRKLLPSQYANFSIALSIFYFFNIAIGPLKMIFARNIPEYLHNNDEGKIKELLLTVSKFISVFSVFLLLLVLLLNNFIIETLKLPSSYFVYIIFFYIVINLFLGSFRGVQNGYRNYSKFTKSYYIESISRLLLTVTILYFFINSISAFSCYVVASIVTLLFLIYKSKDIFKLNRSETKYADILNIAKPLFLFSISFMSFYSLDLIMAKTFLTGEESGYYSAASQLTKSIAIIGSSFKLMLLPHITEKYLNNKNTLLEFLKIIAIFFVIASIVVLFLSFFSEKIMTILYTKKYIDSSTLLLPLGLGTLFMTLSSLIGNYFIAIKRHKIFVFPILFIFIEIGLIYLNHNSSVQISKMFAISQFALFILMFMALFIVKSKDVIVKGSYNV